jgi:8-oxo-dGTP pyrophosphatase MutT (NUDIX family)
MLLVKHTHGYQWLAPGGSIEPNERPADAVVREMWEETGLTVEPVRILGVYGGPEFQITYDNDDRVTYIMIVFECRLRHGNLQLDRDEVVEVGFFSRVELDQLELSPWARIVLPHLFNDRDRTRFQASSWQPA